MFDSPATTTLSHSHIPLNMMRIKFTLHIAFHTPIQIFKMT
jgi:hypothetical protein